MELVACPPAGRFCKPSRAHSPRGQFAPKFHKFIHAFIVKSRAVSGRYSHSPYFADKCGKIFYVPLISKSRTILGSCDLGSVFYQRTIRVSASVFGFALLGMGEFMY